VILFLDFDGVLHPNRRTEPDFSRLPKLWEILRACPHVDVVLSTSWREIYSPAELLQHLTKNGGEDLLERIIGINPSVMREAAAYRTGTYFKRERECQAWLAGNGQQHRYWLALDDIADAFSPTCSNLYLTNDHTGLTDEDVANIIAILRT
jgi:hypothetical protein